MLFHRNTRSKNFETPNRKCCSIDTPNRKTAKESLVDIQIRPTFQFEFISRDTEESKFFDSVDFGRVVFSVEIDKTRIGNPNALGDYDTKTKRQDIGRAKSAGLPAVWSL